MKPIDLSFLIVAFCLLAGVAHAQKGPAGFLKREDVWFEGSAAKQVAANILAHQSDLGGWPKNMDTTVARTGAISSPTFDNGATIQELRFLGRMHRATRDASYLKAFEQGLDCILKAQYPGGGWPQSYPPPSDYRRHVTFNDHVMVNLMEFIREVATRDIYQFMDSGRRAAATSAFDRGIRCILRCQIVVAGKPTAWCAQHDEGDDDPRPARAFEPVSLSGCESVGIVRLLMSLDDPDAATVAAIEGAVNWLEDVRITGHKLLEVTDESVPGGKDKRWVEDPEAPPLWARFYAIGTNKPLFIDRDGVLKYALSEIGHERRNGYAWLGNWPQKLLEKESPQWRETRLKAGP